MGSTFGEYFQRINYTLLYYTEVKMFKRTKFASLADIALNTLVLVYITMVDDEIINK